MDFRMTSLPAQPPDGVAQPRNGQHLPSRLPGVDAVRFVLACWVAWGHVGLFALPDALNQKHGPLLLVRAVYNNLFAGPVAVVAFFVVSGFCIHYPFRRAAQLNHIEFYARRNLRIVVPAAVSVLIGALPPINMTVDSIAESILWSLVCEEIYYLLYPLIFRLRKRVSLDWVIAVAFIAGFAVAATDPTATNYPSFGVELNWVLGFPCWLVGMRLASRDDALAAPPPSLPSMWMWRLGILAASVLLSALRFHTPLTYPWTLNVFAVPAAAWLGAEIRWALAHGRSWLEPFGAWSYSVYLFHLQAGFLVTLAGSHVAEVPGSWIPRAVLILGCCWVFSVVVERPTQRLSRALGELIRRKLA